MAEIACKFQHHNPLILVRESIQGIYGAVLRTIIHIIYGEGMRQAVNDLADVCIGLLNDPRLVVYRNHKINFKLLFWRHRRNSTMAVLSARAQTNDRKRLERELQKQVDHLFLLSAGQRVMERQTDQLVADTFGDRAVADLPAEALSHVRQMQR